MTEAFAAVTVMEFFTTQMPESMRTIAGAVFFLSLSVASYMGSLLVNIIHCATRKRGKSPWLGGHDLNENRLDYYYYVVAALATLNFIYFNFFASHYISSIGVGSGRSPESSIDYHPRNLSESERENERKDLERDGSN